MIEQADIDCAQRAVPNDACFVVSALAGHVIRLLEGKDDAQAHEGPDANTGKGTSGNEDGGAHAKGDICADNHLIAHAGASDDPQADAQPIELPYVCEHCLLDSLPFIVRHATGKTPNLLWTTSWPSNAHQEAEKPEAAASVDRCAQSPKAADSSEPQTEDPTAANDVEPSVQTPKAQSGDPQAKTSTNEVRPRIGIIGNALLCFDSFMNDGIAKLIESQGCDIVIPDPALLFTNDVRYLPQLDRFAEQGVNHVIYLQSFGCLKGHVQARGALHDLARRYPTMPITVIDYDPEASALNRENRVRLAICAAKEALED